MVPIHELLARIRWDRHFARACFALGYYDRIERRVVVVPFEQVQFPADSPGVFELVDAAGIIHSIPFHRVKSVYRDGERIWHRSH